MFEQIFIGSILITATIVVEVIFIQIAITGLKRYGDRFFKSARVIDQVAILTAVTLWMLTALSLSIWVWAFAFWELGAFTTLEEALYFSMVSFTTLGFGDVTLPQTGAYCLGLLRPMD